MTVAVGLHGSATPMPVLRKLGVDLVVRGECEEIVAAVADSPDRWDIPGTAFFDADGALQVVGGPASAQFSNTPALVWPQEWVTRHAHHHHRFDAEPLGPGAEVEASRGCPYACTFCAKIDFRDGYRRRALEPLLAEIDGLITQGVTYITLSTRFFSRARIC
jgi:radical SAM superfamily enzyme YgiQ (UPF0313 family)